MTVGDRGRVVLPVELRQHREWGEGTTLLAIETERGVILATRIELEALVRAQLAGPSMVDDLLADRRAASRREDAV
jgi:bifunctional DNA-binding transcriptional regulator/antitoxin component of YhaV-PrlF toxin-antitoxin module